MLGAALLTILLAAQGARAEPAGAPRTLDSFHLFEPPATRAAWESRREELRRRVLVAAGLWPLPERPPLAPVIHGAVERDGYTVEKVFFASLPGHYVSGSLYRPSAPAPPDGGPRAAVLSPHGHWSEGRFMELSGEEGNERWPLQARCAELARLGCVVFHYDMVGYGDSTAIRHGRGFTDHPAVLAGQSFLGLQLWNSMRALDFLCSLPDVDPARVGVTGESGGGTQTFLLCAVDDRPAAAFAAAMVSSRMQGGCVCENAPHLRIGTDNVELAGLFAPKPLALTGADDWTVAIETEGLPELAQVWGLYGAADLVAARAWPDHPHGFDRPAREMMYAWFNRHLGLGHAEPIVERSIVPLARSELSVYDAQHPRPADEGGADAVRAWWSEARARELARLFPRDRGALERYREVVGGALDALLGPFDPPPAPRPSPDRVVVVAVVDGEWAELRCRDLEHLGAEVRRVRLPRGEPPIDPDRHADYVGYSYGYNPTALALSARRIRAELLAARGSRAVRLFALRGSPDYGDSGAAVLALASAGRAAGVDQAVIEASSTWFFSLEHPSLLPGIDGIGGLSACLPLLAPIEVWLPGWETIPAATRAAYAAAGAGAAIPAPRLLQRDIWRLAEAPE